MSLYVSKQRVDPLKKIAVLTGGGDCPGLNPAIQSVTESAEGNGYSVVGIREGWKGLCEKKPLVQELNSQSVSHINRQGGTILGTSRTNPYQDSTKLIQLLANWKALKLDALIAIGGEDTLGVAAKLFADHQLPICGIPKTIDLDLPGTDYCLGFESAVQVITESVDRLRSTAESHARIFVVEVMGRHAGHLALQGGIAAGAQVILIPEQDFEPKRVLELLQSYKQKGHRYGIVIVAEGAKAKNSSENLKSAEKDAFGHVRLGGIGQWLSDLINSAGLESRSVNLSHLQRGGSPVAYDRRMGFAFGVAAIGAIKAQTYGQLVSLSQGLVVLKPLSIVTNPIRPVDLNQSYDTINYRAQ